MYNHSYHTADLSKYSFLVTGGAGFIGSNLVEYLLKFGAKHVRVLDNFSTGHKANVLDFFGNPAFELVTGDIRSLKTCERAMEGVDFVFHEAALGSVPRSIQDPVTTNEVNISGFLNILVAARNSGVKRLVYAASSSTYGDSTELPKVEDRIGKPLSPYAITKYVNELYADVFTKLYGLELIGLRYFNVFGPRQDPDGAYAAVIPKFTDQLLKHQSPQINGDGSYTRDFTYIENVVQMNVKCMFTQNSKALSQVFNVACGENTSLNQLVRYLKIYLAQYDPAVSSVKVLNGPNRAGDIPHSLADISKAQQIIGYNPLFSIEDGLKEAVQWYVKEKLHSTTLYKAS